MANRQSRQQREQERRRLDTALRRRLRRGKERARRQQDHTPSFRLLAEAGFRYAMLPGRYRTPRNAELCRWAVSMRERDLRPCYQHPDELIREVLDHPRIPFSLELAVALLRGRVHRPVSSWRPPRSRCPRRTLLSLLRHLFVRYPMPRVLPPERLLDWLEEHVYRSYIHWQLYENIELDLYFHLAAGKGLHQLSIYGLSFSRRANYYYHLAPRRLSWIEALNWARARAQGAPAPLAERLARAVSRGYFPLLAELFDEILPFFRRYPDCEETVIQELAYFYLEQQRESVYDYDVKTGISYELPPLLPRMSLKGRTLASVRRLYEQWKTTKQQTLSALMTKGFEEPLAEPLLHADEAEQVLYEIVPLLRAEELVEEGRRMQHCVASYAGSCLSGSSSIWSVRRWPVRGRMERLATVEVFETGLINQVHARCNRPPKPIVAQLVQRWMEQNEGLLLTEQPEVS